MHPPRRPSMATLSEAPQVKLPEGVAPFMHITQNEFFGQKYKKLKEEDISICECHYDAFNTESACGESCLNVLTNTECTPGYCPCVEYCRNQKFQRCEYAKTRLFKTEGRGWGLVADECIKAGQFIIEYCGEVISSEEATERSHAYETQGLKDAYIISLNANYFIDATNKGSIARFINHSCEPNCETRKWTVLGVTRVGIFAKKDISVGTELAYDYNFEWYGGANVRCLCGASNCSLFLGAKSHGFQEYNHVWEDGDDRYIVENIPLYDSAEDDPFPKPACSTIRLTQESQAGRRNTLCVLTHDGEVSEIKLEATISSVRMPGEAINPVESEKRDEPVLCLEDRKQIFSQTNAMISRIRSNSACRNYKIGPGPTSKKKSLLPRQKAKMSGQKFASCKPVAELFASEEFREEISKYEVILLEIPTSMNIVHFQPLEIKSDGVNELKNRATSELNLLYDEIRPAIEEREKDSQDSVPTSLAEKWIHATCSKWKSEFDFHFNIVKNVICGPKMASGSELKTSGEENSQNEMKYLTS